MKNPFYITTTTPYVNGEPHIGFALEIVQADVIARFHSELKGEEVIFNTGTDEHGQKIYEKAIEVGKTPKKYCDENALRFEDLKKILNLSFTNFIRTTDEHHKKAAQEFWRRCEAKGDIKKKKYKIRYCVGCELEKTDSELVEGKCPLHPIQTLDIREEENYFFSFSKYQKPLLKFYENYPQFVVPDFRLQEIKNFVQKGLTDFSISRLRNKMPWGVDIPDDNDHIMYVWFDALVNYISTLGWPEDTKNFNKFWPGVQVAGKDNLRQQSAMWQAMLMSADLAPTKQIFIHGFISSAGQKMSKSLGNVINPVDLVKKYGVDAVRYYLLKEIPAYSDGDFSHARMKEIYNSDLANELGNLVSRVTNLAEKYSIKGVINEDKNSAFSDIENFIVKYQFDNALQSINNMVKALNSKLDKEAPWKNAGRRGVVITELLKEINVVGKLLLPFLPGTAEKIIKSTSGKIKKIQPLFPRI